MRSLPEEIFTLMHERHASHNEGVAAMITALVVSEINHGLSKDRALEMFSDCWDTIAPAVKETMERGHGRC